MYHHRRPNIRETFRFFYIHFSLSSAASIQADTECNKNKTSNRPNKPKETRMIRKPTERTIKKSEFRSESEEPPCVSEARHR